MNQAELIDQIASKAGVSKADVKKVLDAQTAVVHQQLINANDVILPGIGKFGVANRKARTGRNPGTGAAIEIPAKIVPTFSAAKALKDVVNA